MKYPFPWHRFRLPRSDHPGQTAIAARHPVLFPLSLLRPAPTTQSTRPNPSFCPAPIYSDTPTQARIGPQVLAFYRKLLNLRLLFNNQKKLKLSSVFKWLDISELKMPKLVDLCAFFNCFPNRDGPLYKRRVEIPSGALPKKNPGLRKTCSD